MLKTIALLSLGLLISLPGSTFAMAAGPKTFDLDLSHSAIGFKVRHLGVSTVRGKFNSYAGNLVVQDGKLTSANATIQVDSIDTDNAKRDKHLKQDDFFAVTKHPTITFKVAV